jgi:peptidoglycan hydrolase-like protein with peptidoglycan-binding domain
MAYSLTWLSQVLLDAGLKVAEQPGWVDRGIAEMGTVKGVICHHTAGPKNGNMPSLAVITNGRPDLRGPLAQLGLGRDGTFYVVAAGRANHAGAGSWKNITTGNSSFIGIEAENSGTPDDPWPPVQMEAYHRGVAAILKKIGADEGMCCGHKEYALPTGRKTDPSFEMVPFRGAVADILAGRTPALQLIAANDGLRLTLRRGDTGDAVKQLQTKLGQTADGRFSPLTEEAVREFQRDKALVPDGIVGPRTWAQLG